MVHQTNSEHFTNQPETTPLPPAAERIAQSHHYFRETALHTVLKSSIFNKKRADGAPGVQAFSGTAAELAQSPDDIDDFDRSILSLTSQLGIFVDANEELSTLTKQRQQIKDTGETYPQALSDQIQTLKLDYLIPFNHSLKELINDYPALNIEALTQNIAIAYQGIYSHYNNLHPEQPAEEFSRIPMNNVLQDIEYRINGMRHEIAAETLLSAAGVEYHYELTNKQDQKGRDMFVKLDGKWVGVDIKSSLAAEVRAHQRLNKSRAVWTGLKPQDFRGMKDDAKDSVTIPYSVAQEHAEAFVERIRRMVSGELKQADRETQTGKIAIQAMTHSS